MLTMATTVTKGTGVRRWWALGAVTLAVLAVGMDLTVLSVALPTLAGALKASESDLQWFSSGYALVLAAAMLPAGLLGDRYGRKKVMLCSLALFAVGSLACAYSRTPAEFIGARIILGFAGAGLVVMAVSALAVLFTDEERPKAVGIWAAANMVAFPIGPILGGWLLTHYWWGWVFLLNVPVAILGFVAVALLVPESASSVRPGIDFAGIVGSSAGLVGVTYGFIQAGQNGWSSARALVPLVCGTGSDRRVLLLGEDSRAASGRPTAHRPEPFPFPFVHMGSHPLRSSHARTDRAALHDAPVLPGCRRHEPRGLGSSPFAGRRRHARRPAPRGQDLQGDRRKTRGRARLSRDRHRPRNRGLRPRLLRARVSSRCGWRSSGSAPD